MAAIVLLVVGAVGIVAAVALLSWKAALVVLFVFVFGLGVDLGRGQTARRPDGDG